MQKAIVGLALVAALGSSAELLQNGTFENGTAGWTLAVDSTEGSWSADARPDYDERDQDCEALVWKLLRYSTSLSQTVNLPSLATRFAGDARLIAYIAQDTTYYAYAAVTLEYQNAAGTALGRTMVLRQTDRSPLTNTPTRHLIFAPDEEWRGLGFIIADELANLPGVTPADVAGVVVRLNAYGTGIGG
jgi:hypothetical protein